MNNLFQRLAFPLLTALFALGLFCGIQMSDMTFTVVCFLGLILSVFWTLTVWGKQEPKKEVLPMSKVSTIGAHVQDTTALTGSITQLFSSLP